VVRSNILVRTNYHHVYGFPKEERESLPPILDSREVAFREFMDHFLNYSSPSAGLGIFPALLGLTTEKKFEGLLLHYKKLFHDFEVQQSYSLIDYRLRRKHIMSVVENTLYNLWKSLPETAEVLSSMRDALKFVQSDGGKVAVIFCSSDTDSEIAGYALELELLRQRKCRFVSIDCDYFHKHPADCVELMLKQELRLKSEEVQL
jgi:hypothetical protein